MTSPIFVFIGSKGGAGATTVCYELAKVVAGDGGNVALIDGDMAGRRSIAILMDALQELDAARTGPSVAAARVSGMTVAELAERYDTAFTIDHGVVEAFAASLTGFSAVLLDAPQPFAAAVRPFIMRAARFFVVVEPTVLGVAGAKSMLNNLHRFGIPASRIAMLTNARDSTGSLPRTEIEDALGMRLVAELLPATNRNFGRNLLGLQRYVASVPPESVLAFSQPSTSVPIGDRRHEPRRAYSAAERNGRAGKTGAGSAKNADKYDAIKLAIHAALVRRVDLVVASQAHTDKAKLAELRAKIEAITSEYILEQHFEGSAEETAILRQEIVNEALGLGPLEDLIHDPDVTEIMVNGPDSIYVERFGKIDKTKKRFSDERQLRLIIERIITPLGRRIDESSPMVDARLADGSRVNAIIEPLSLGGATLTIRRFGVHRLQADDLLKSGSVTSPVLDLLRAAIEARLNVVVSGGTGSGKTTFLNILSGYVPDRERIVTIEDAAELLLNKPHVVRLESRPANVEGAGEIRIRDLLRNSLRMRPDRIIIGECRGAEALDMLQAMNTGHDGSITTIHANSARDALARIETMVLMAGFDLPVRAIREQVASAIDFIIHTARMRDGSRKIVSISEVAGMEGEIVTMQELVRYAQQGMDKEGKVIGEFQYTGVQPNCLKRFEEYGISYDSRALSSLASTGALW